MIPSCFVVSLPTNLRRPMQTRGYVGRDALPVRILIHPAYSKLKVHLKSSTQPEGTLSPTCPSDQYVLERDRQSISRRTPCSSTAIRIQAMRAQNTVSSHTPDFPKAAKDNLLREADGDFGGGHCSWVEAVVYGAHTRVRFSGRKVDGSNLQGQILPCFGSRQERRSNSSSRTDEGSNGRAMAVFHPCDNLTEELLGTIKVRG